MQCVRPAAIGGGHLFDLRFVHLGDLVKKGLGLRLVGAKRIERHSPVRLLARFGNLLHGVLRAFPAKNVFAVRIRKVINLFRLPGPQILQIRFQSLRRPGNLLRKRNWVARQIERFGCQHAGSLVVAVVFANKSSRKKCENRFRPREPHEPDQLLQRFAMIPVRQRLQYILRRRVLATEKPYVGDAQRRQCIPRFNLADRAERRRLFRSSFIRAAAAARAKHNCNSLMFVECARKIRRGRALVVGMRHDQQNVHFVPLVRQRKRFGLLRAARRH